MSSSTAESEDESICRLREAADTSFISDALFKARKSVIIFSNQSLNLN